MKDNISLKQLTVLLKKLHPNLNREDLRLLAIEVYKNYAANDIVIEHNGSSFVVQEHTKIRTQIEGVSFTPIATNVFDTLLGHMLMKKNYKHYRKNGLVDSSVVDELQEKSQLMFDWLLCQNPEYITALSKKYERVIKKSRYK